MNQTFSLSRFGRLLYKHLSDNRGQLLTSIALLAGILLIGAFLFYTGLPFQADRNRGISLIFFGWPLWYVFTWQQVEVLNNRERSISYLLQPASQLEKFLLIWLISGIGFLLVFFGLFVVVDAIGVAYVNAKDWTPDQLTTIRQVDGLLTIKPFYQSVYMWPPVQLRVFTVLLHPFCLAAFLFVRRYSLPIVAVLILALLAVGYFINSAMLTGLLHTTESLSVLPFERAIVESPAKIVRKLEFPQPIGDTLRYVTGMAGVLLLYIIAFFRLNEREV